MPIFKKITHIRQSWNAKRLAYIVEVEKTKGLSKHNHDSALSNYIYKYHIKKFDFLNFLDKSHSIFNDFRKIHPPTLQRMYRLCDLNHKDRLNYSLSSFYLTDPHCLSAEFAEKIKAINSWSILDIKNIIDNIYQVGFFINEDKLIEVLKLNPIDFNQTFNENSHNWKLCTYVCQKFMDKIININLNSQNTEFPYYYDKYLDLFERIYKKSTIKKEDCYYILNVFSQIKLRVNCFPELNLEKICKWEMELEQKLLSFNLMSVEKENIKLIKI